ncbi:ankyrin [Wilcoxina mikolae CBS 423.85]|nr:ankyrin [Wilcoxina mikolae CBS 423.85]
MAVSLNRLLDYDDDYFQMRTHAPRLLSLAIECNQEHIMELLLSRGAQIEANKRIISGKTPLLMAVQFGINSNLVEILLSHGANPNVRCTNDFNSFRGYTALHIAASSGDARSVEKVRMLLENAANTDDRVGMTRKSGRTAIHCAASVGNPEAIRHLVEYGANIKVKVRGMTPLERFEKQCASEYMRCQPAYAEVVELLGGKIATRASATTGSVLS